MMTSWILPSYHGYPSPLKYGNTKDDPFVKFKIFMMFIPFDQLLTSAWRSSKAGTDKKERKDYDERYERWCKALSHLKTRWKGLKNFNARLVFVRRNGSLLFGEFNKREIGFFLVYAP